MKSLLDAQSGTAEPVASPYGTTSQGGDGGCTSANGVTIGCGIVFELSPAKGSWQETILHSFPRRYTGRPQLHLPGWFSIIREISFGTTLSGGSGYSQSGASGTVFELSPQESGGWKESLPVEFPSSDGQSVPYGSLILDAAGNLYSTTAAYGGAVFKLSSDSRGGWNYSTLYAFGTGGPEAGLIFGPYGYLYGTAVFGGTRNSGFVFAITP